MNDTNEIFSKITSTLLSEDISKILDRIPETAKKAFMMDCAEVLAKLLAIHVAPKDVEKLLKSKGLL